MRRSSVAIAIASLAVLTAVYASPGVAGAGGGACYSITGVREAEAEGTDATVQLRRNCFEPVLLRVEPGTTVLFVNNDEAKHQVTGPGYEWGANTELIQQATFAQTFGSPGVYPYSCSLHVGMTGVIVVGDADAGAVQASISDSQPERESIAGRSSSSSQGDGLPSLAVAGLGLLAGIGVTSGAAGLRRLRK